MDNKRKLMPPHYLLATLIAMFVLDRYFPLLSFGSQVLRYAGALPMLLGVGITVTSAGLFKKAGTPLRPFEQSTTVVTTGMFRFTRNPMYLGMVLSLLGIATFLGSLTAFLPIPLFVAIIHFEFIRNEERFMEKLFGEQYLAFKSRVRRWV